MQTLQGQKFQTELRSTSCDFMTGHLHNQFCRRLKEFLVTAILIGKLVTTTPLYSDFWPACKTEPDQLKTVNIMRFSDRRDRSADANCNGDLRGSASVMLPVTKVRFTIYPDNSTFDSWTFLTESWALGRLRAPVNWHWNFSNEI